MLNLAGFGSPEHRLMTQARIGGVKDILAASLVDFQARLRRAATELRLEPPEALTSEGWWEQAKTLEEE